MPRLALFLALALALVAAGVRAQQQPETAEGEAPATVEQRLTAVEGRLDRIERLLAGEVREGEAIGLEARLSLMDSRLDRVETAVKRAHAGAVSPTRMLERRISNLERELSRLKYR